MSVTYVALSTSMHIKNKRPSKAHSSGSFTPVLTFFPYQDDRECNTEHACKDTPKVFFMSVAIMALTVHVTFHRHEESRVSYDDIINKSVCRFTPPSHQTKATESLLY